MTCEGRFNRGNMKRKEGDGVNRGDGTEKFGGMRSSGSGGSEVGVENED